jgi:hypothetical protein
MRLHAGRSLPGRDTYAVERSILRLLSELAPSGNLVVLLRKRLLLPRDEQLVFRS